MVVCAPEHSLQADIIFVIEATAVNGAYINDLKSNYIIPSLEYFSQGNVDENNYVSENANSLYGIVLYYAADCLPHPSSDTIGPFSSPGKILSAIDKLELLGGKGESHANVAEGLATALQCFEELQQKRDPNANAQKHCVLICNSPPYLLPALESFTYSGKTAEQLAGILQEKNINLSVISPRKIPSLYKLFEKSGGDLSSSQTKNYAKDPRHLVLLKGFSLKERPISPPTGNVNAPQAQLSSSMPITSLPSPRGGTDSPIPGTAQNNSNLLTGGNAGGVGVQPGQSPVYRPPSAGLNTLPQHTQSIVSQGLYQIPQQNQPMVSQGMSQMPSQSMATQGMGMVNPRGAMMANQSMPVQQMNAPPGYHAAATTGMGAQRPQARWGMLPPQSGQQRPFMQNPQTNQTQGSALIAQLTQPPSSMSATGVNQFPMNANSPINQSQSQPQSQIKINLPNVQTSMAQNQSGIQATSMSQVTQSNQASLATSQAQGTQQAPQQMGPGRERHTIWQGVLEWLERPKNSADQQKIPKHVPCQVSTNSRDGEPELKADGWPSKLIMQLMPKQLIGNIGGIYLKNSKSVLFHPQACEALESLTKVMSSGMAGCVHFTGLNNPTPCNIKILILLYTSEKRAFLGFIPNDQGAFVDRLRKIIQQQQKSSQQMLRNSQGGAGPSMNPQGSGPLTMGGTPPQMVTSPVTSQTAQQGLMMSQTNTMAMGGGQITQNVVSSNGQPGSGIGVLGQNVGTPGMQSSYLQGMQPSMGPQSNQPGGNFNMAPGMSGAPVQRAPIENQIQAERQHNLEKINHLKQTLEAAQQQEQQYKTQLERISHIKTAQLQEALQLAQQTEMQYKMLDQQRMTSQGNPQAPNPQQQNQQRLMRPVMANNPGLRHLLQQQPQYRQQVIGIQQMQGNGPRNQMGHQMPNQGGGQSTFEDVPNFDFMP